MKTQRIQNIILWTVCIILVGLVAALVAEMFTSVLESFLGMVMITYPFQFPNLPRVMPCPACLDKDGKPISTVHRRTDSGLWVCWCGTVADQEAEDEKDIEL